MTNLPADQSEAGASPQGGIALEPPAATNQARFPGGPGRPPIRRQARVIHDVTRSEKRPPGLRLTVGFVLVVGAAWLCFLMPGDYWHIVTGAGEVCERWFSSVESQDATPAVSAPVPDWAEWAQWCVSGLLVILGALCLRANLLYYLLTCAMIWVSGNCADLLLEAKIDWPWLVLGALGLGYVFHLGWRIGPPKVAGFVGWGLIAFCSIGIVQNIFDWSAIGDRLGEGTAEFVSKWSEQLSWGTVLLLTAFGVSLSRSRPIHLLNAALLGLLAYYCYTQGCYEVVSFPELAKGDYIPTVELSTYKNLEPWQWVLVGELALLGVILLHMALGVGALAVGFAVLWLVAGLHVDRAFYRMGLARQFSRSIVREGGTVSESTILEDGSMGLPSEEAPGDAAGEPAQRSMTNKEVQNADVIGAVTPIVWFYLTAMIAGLIGVAGLRMLTDNAALRLWVLCALWLAFGLGAMWLSGVWPRAPEQTWASWLAGWGIDPLHRDAACLLTLGVTALVGIWALRSGSRYDTWLSVAVVSTFVGTALSLGAVAILIRYGGFPRLPVWSYAGIAVGQSSLMWVLLMHHNLAARRGPIEQP